MVQHIQCCSGLISDCSTIQEAVTSIKRNGVGLKGNNQSSRMDVNMTYIDRGIAN